MTPITLVDPYNPIFILIILVSFRCEFSFITYTLNTLILRVLRALRVLRVYIDSNDTYALYILCRWSGSLLNLTFLKRGHPIFHETSKMGVSFWSFNKKSIYCYYKYFICNIEKNNSRLCSSTFKSPIIGEFDRRILRKKIVDDIRSKFFMLS